MKKWTKHTISICIFTMTVIGLGCLFAYWKLSPAHYIEQVHPVIAKPSEQQTDPSEQEKKGSFTVLILGIDARTNEASRTDAIMIAYVNLQNKTVNLVSIPRDTRVNIPGIGYTKINHAHFLGYLDGGNQSGTEATIQAVSDFLNIPINYYIKFNFDGFVHFIDTIGGIDIDLRDSVKLTYPSIPGDFIIPSGQQHLNGGLALDFVRERYSLSNGDFGRQNDQAVILKAVMQKLLQPAYLPNLPKLMNEVKKDVLDTNFNINDLISLSWMLKGITTQQLHYIQIPGHSEEAMDPLLKLNLYYWVPDSESVKSISQQYLQTPLSK